MSRPRFFLCREGPAVRRIPGREYQVKYIIFSEVFPIAGLAEGVLAVGWLLVYQWEGVPSNEL
jgi:hypothetical protein